MVTAIVRGRGGHGLYPARPGMQQISGAKRRKLPEYLSHEEVQAMLQAADGPQARLLMLVMFRAGLRVSEALGVTRADIRIMDGQPVLYVRQGKGNKPRMVPLHPDLIAAFDPALGYLPKGDGPIIPAHRGDGLQVCKGGAGKSYRRGRATGWPQGRRSHLQVQRSPSLAGERRPNQRRQPLARPCEHPDDFDLPGRAAGPARDDEQGSMRRRVGHDGRAAVEPGSPIVAAGASGSGDHRRRQGAAGRGEAAGKLLGPRQFAFMKPGSLFIHTERAGLVDETALAYALTGQLIGGATLDVFAQEPLPADSPLRYLPNVILSPHAAASAAEVLESSLDAAAAIVLRYFDRSP